MPYSAGTNSPPNTPRELGLTLADTQDNPSRKKSTEYSCFGRLQLGFAADAPLGAAIVDDQRFVPGALSALSG
jgi:hypothetical protein